MHQTTVDAYLEDIVSSAIERTANAQARQDIHQMASVINDAAYDAEKKSLLLFLLAHHLLFVLLLFTVELHLFSLFPALFVILCDKDLSNLPA